MRTAERDDNDLDAILSVRVTASVNNRQELSLMDGRGYHVTGRILV